MPLDPSTGMFWPTSYPDTAAQPRSPAVTAVVPLVGTTVGSTTSGASGVSVPGAGGRYTAKVVTELGNTTLFSGVGRLNSILFNTAAGGIVTVYDQGLNQNSGVMIAYFAAATTIGTYQILNIPFQYGISIQQATAASTITVNYSQA